MPPAFVTYQKIRWRYIGLADGQPSQERYALLRLCQVLASHAAEIHRRNAVIIGLIPACTALKDVIQLVTVTLVCMPALRAVLTGVCRIHPDHELPVQCSLVLQLLLKVIVGP